MAPVHVSLRIPGTAPMLDLVKLIQDVEPPGSMAGNPRQSVAVPRHVHHDGAGGDPHVRPGTVSRGDQSVQKRRVSTLPSAIQTVEDLAVPSAPGAARV
jgi:hypothetical protein